MTREERRDLIQIELAKLPYAKRNGDEIVIFCPFHEDKNTPNLNVHVGHKTGVGSFFCWTCKTGGGWNKLADKLGLTRFTKDSESPEEQQNAFSSFSFDLEEIDQRIQRDNRSYHKPNGLQPWVGEWRGLSESFLTSVGAMEWYDKTSDAYRIWFPVTKYGVLVGHVGGRTDDVTQPKYRNSAGLPMDVLFGADNIKSKEAIILVEGPFDCLRLQALGLPAASILGVPHWNAAKISTLVGYGFKHIYVVGDGDNAGWDLNRSVFFDLRSGWNVDYLDLPIFEEKEKKLDPGNMPIEYVNMLKKMVGLKI